MLEQAVALTLCNPFSPERAEAERRAFGGGGNVGGGRAALTQTTEAGDAAAAYRHFMRRVDRATHRVRRVLIERGVQRDQDAVVYRAASLHLLYHEMVERGDTGRLREPRAAATVFDRFEAAFKERLILSGVDLPGDPDAAHGFACLAQITRAFEAVYANLLGRSAPAVRLRAACWESVFTHDIAAYVDGVYRQMPDFTTLITGPSGTGKELVAQAIGGSGYVAFDPATRRFVGGAEVLPVNLAALSTTLIESELFGHKRGAFTGAIADREGYLDACTSSGCVFLDEIGDLEPVVQVKLLRVLQERVFTRVGETRARPFRGKLVVATHRDLPALMASGSFRQDFFYRVCSDTVRTPSLLEQLSDRPEDLEIFVRHLGKRALGRAEHVLEPLVERTLQWVRERLDRPGRPYPWPGNIRELEQCVRSVLLHGVYHPPEPGSPVHGGQSEEAGFAAWMAEGQTAEQVHDAYVRYLRAGCGSDAAAARAAGLDRRTVKRICETS